MRGLRTPNRADVARIISEECDSAGVDRGHVLYGARTRAARYVRHAAIRRIIAETGCSQMGLAKAWGISDATVRAALKPTTPARPTETYDPYTRKRLLWARGEQRTALIVAGADPETQRDIEAWSRLA